MKPEERQTFSKELLDVGNSKTKHSDKLVFSLLNEKKKEKGTFRIGPSTLLQRVKEFLPQLEKANQQVHTDITLNPDKQKDYDIQNVDETSGSHIEMDLALYEDSDSDVIKQLEPASSSEEEGEEEESNSELTDILRQLEQN